MKTSADPLQNIRIATPCPAKWETMSGDERSRFCSLCSLNVYNISEMSAAEARELIRRTEGRLCARIYRRADGTVITNDCPTGVRALRARLWRAAAAAIAMVLTLSTFGFGKSRAAKRGSIFVTQTDGVTATDSTRLHGAVSERDGAVLPGVSVTATNESTRLQVTVVSDPSGTFAFSGLPAGAYTVRAELSGFKTATVEHVIIAEGKVNNARIILDLLPVETITVGAIAVDPLTYESTVSTTFSGERVGKLPL